MSANLHGEWDAYQKLDRLGDPWAALNELVDFEAFRDILEDCWRPADAGPRKGGRPPYDAVLMFKLLLVGRRCGLSDEKLEVLAHDSLRNMRFLGVTMSDFLPDRDDNPLSAQLDLNTMHELLEAFNAQLAAKGYAARDGQMMDSSFTLVPIQRNTRD